jgi:hypothetical protein
LVGSKLVGSKLVRIVVAGDRQVNLIFYDTIIKLICQK